MNHSNEEIWEPPLAGGKPRRLTHFTASRIFDFNWFFDHARLLLTRGNVNSDVVLLSNLTECIPFLDLAIRWARTVLGNSSCLVARCLLTPVRTSAGAFSTAGYSFCNRSSLVTFWSDIGRKGTHKASWIPLYNFAKARLLGCFSEAYSRREPVQNPKRRDFKQFECLDHTPLAEPLRPAKMKTL